MLIIDFTTCLSVLYVDQNGIVVNWKLLVNTMKLRSLPMICFNLPLIHVCAEHALSAVQLRMHTDQQANQFSAKPNQMSCCMSVMARCWLKNSSAVRPVTLLGSVVSWACFISCLVRQLLNCRVPLTNCSIIHEYWQSGESIFHLH